VFEPLSTVINILGIDAKTTERPRPIRACERGQTMTSGQSVLLRNRRTQNDQIWLRSEDSGTGAAAGPDRRIPRGRHTSRGRVSQAKVFLLPHWLSPRPGRGIPRCTTESLPIGCCWSMTYLTPTPG
jgi:hypothetical protein